MTVIYQPSYNFEVLGFLNVLTGDPFYIGQNREDYEYFYPLLSEAGRRRIADLVDAVGRTNLAFPLHLLANAVSGRSDKDVLERFSNRKAVAAVVEILRQMPYVEKRTLDQMDSILENASSLVEELELIGFRTHWEADILPAIKSICTGLTEYTATQDFRELFVTLRSDVPKHVTVYICRFERPHGTKLSQTGSELILSDNAGKEMTVSLLIHELFHTPYDPVKASPALEAIAEKSWVIEAYENQNENCRYAPMAYFLEENIVEALGIYVANAMGAEKDPYGYFERHDYGSHVVSPHLFRYLTEHPKQADMPMEAYLATFAAQLK